MKKKEERLVYEPVAGLTISDAFARAIIMAKKARKTVHAIVNEIEMDVTGKSNLKRLVTTYQKKNQARYEAEMRAYEQRKRQGR